MPCQLITFSFDKKDVPVLIFNRHSSVTDIENINGGELVRKLKSEKSRFEDIKIICSRKQKDLMNRI